jgi:hypothetical protein
MNLDDEALLSKSLSMFHICIFHSRCDFFDQFEEAVGRLPDTSIPVAQQLDEAVTTIKRNVKIILDSKAQTELLKKV